MSELEDKLSAILGNPQAMSQIMSLAQSLGGGASSAGDGARAGTDPAPPAAPAEQTGAAPAPPEPGDAPAAPAGQGSAQSAAPDLSGLLGALGGGGSGLDPRLLTLATRVMQEYQSEDDGRIALLNALRPFVKEKRYAKVDKAIQIARLSRLIRVALDVFKGGDHV